MPESSVTEIEQLAHLLVEVTSQTALAAAKTIGLGDERASDQAAVDAMRAGLASLPIDGRIVIGEGERDNAPMLFAGEELGQGGIECDIAVDPLEGTSITAKGLPNALCVLAVARRGQLLNAPDVYMEKIAAGPGIPEGALDLDATAYDNLGRVAEILGCRIQELSVCVLDRPRHSELIADIRKAGARIVLIGDGDINAAIQAAQPDTGVDLYMGTGGAPEGVLAAAALCSLGGHITGRLMVRNDTEAERLRACGIVDAQRKYQTKDLASGDILFAATGVTPGALLDGVYQDRKGGVTTHSLVLGTGRRISQRIDTRYVMDKTQ